MKFLRPDTNLWEAVRDLQEALRQLDDRLESLEALRSRRSAQRDWLLSKLIPGVAAVAIAFAALDTLFHWTM